MSLPVVMTAAGASPQSPASLNSQLIALATASDPGLTANLPGTLIEDIASTDTAALVLIDQAQVETINSITPYGCNLFVLNQQGQLVGVQQGLGSNTSVNVVFSGTPGYVIPQGVIVSDGTYQYITQQASVIDSTGSSNTVYCVSNSTGSWAVPANSVTTISTSIPTGITLTVTNPTTGTPSTSIQSPEDYRAQVIAAYTVGPSGTTSAIRTAVAQVSGVVQSLISVRQNAYYSPAKWEVIVGGGDPTAVAAAIYSSCGDPNTLCGSIMQVVSVTTGSPTKITTNLVTGFTSGESIKIANATGITGINGTWSVTPVSGDPFSFTIPYSSSGTYTGNGVVTVGTTGTIPRNQSVTIYDKPDSYTIPYVIPIQQPVTMTVTWNTTSSSIITNAAIAAQAGQPICDYVNGLGPGQSINIYELQYIFQEAVVSLIPTPLLTHIVFAIAINGVAVVPAVGTNTVVGDPEGYYYMITSNITFTQG